MLLLFVRQCNTVLSSIHVPSPGSALRCAKLLFMWTRAITSCFAEYRTGASRETESMYIAQIAYLLAAKLISSPENQSLCICRVSPPGSKTARTDPGENK